MKKILLGSIVALALLLSAPTFANALAPVQASRGSILMEYETGTIIKETNSNARYPIASMVKITSLLLTFENLDKGKFNLNDKVLVSERASSMGGSQVFLDANQYYEAEQLIKSVIISSANDSCVALAEMQFGSEQLFVDEMNKRAQELNLKNTHYVNCTGLPQQGQYSSAYDVAVLTRQLMSHAKYFNYSKIWMDEITHPSGRKTGLTNTNKLVRFYNGCDGGKTGYTGEALHCLSATAMKNNMRLISVVIGGADSKSRFDEARQNLDYGFSNYECKLMVDDTAITERQKVKYGVDDYVSVKPLKKLYCFGKKGEISKSEIKIELQDKVNAPVCSGDKLGCISIVENGKVTVSTDLVASNDVKKSSFLDILDKIIKSW